MSHGPTLETERARELLPWLLNGTLEEGERAQVLDALRTSPRLRRELTETHWAGLLFARHLPTADVVAYAFGEATATEHALVESHLASCAGCRDELAMARLSLAVRDAERRADDSRGADVVPFAPPPAPARPAMGVSPVWRMAAMAAALVAVVGLGGWLNTWQQAEDRNQGLTARVEGLDAQLGELVTSLEAAAAAPRAEVRDAVGEVGFAAGTVRAAAGAPKPLVLSSLDGMAELRFWPEGGPGTPVYEVRLLHAEDGSELLRITPLRPGEDGILRARVAAERLPEGFYDAVLHRSDPESGWREIERHPVEVKLAGPASAAAKEAAAAP